MNPTLSAHRHTADTEHAKASAAKASFKRASGNFEGGFCGTEASVRGERHRVSAVTFMVAGGGFEPPTFG
jgi:hypothetical protein